MNMSDLMGSAATPLRGRWLFSESMARHVSWRAGGPADRVYVPVDSDDLGIFLRGLAVNEPLCFVGLGSNLLVRDGGFRGTVVLMHSSRASIRTEGAVMYASAGAACPKLARLAAVGDLEGAEFLAGVPGTIGGALAMNAGCHGSQTWEFVQSVFMIDRAGVQRERCPAEFEIAYRHVALRGGARLGHDEWFVGASFRFSPGDGALARNRIRELLTRRIATQPLGLPNAGSVFRNPEGDHAARLIEACGLKGASMGGARISEQHANFIVNPGGVALAADIEALISHARNVVRVKLGIDLVAEVRIVGDAAARTDANGMALQAGQS